LSGDILYGRTRAGGHEGVGTIYKLNTDGSGYAILNSSFDLGLQNRSLALVANTLYWGGGAVNTDGTGLTVFGTSVVSGLPSLVSGLIYSGNTLYGTTSSDGMGSGTVFSILVPPKLSVALSWQNILVTWPTNAVGFNLQSATTLANGGDWQDSATVPTQINGQNVVSMGITNPASFYRLRSP
jgi:hypothetical protein